MKRRLTLGTLVFFLVFASGAIPARAGTADNLLPMDKAEAMKKMLMEMPPDTSVMPNTLRICHSERM